MSFRYLVSIYFLFFTTIAAADVVELDNGDRLTGTVRSLLDGRLTMSTPYASEVVIDFDQITRLVSETELVVRVEGEEPIETTFSVQGDRLEVAGRSQALSRSRLQSVEPVPETVPDPSWVQGWKGGADFGWVLARGNSDIRTLSLSVTPVRTTNTDKTTLAYRILNSRQDGTTSADQWSLDGRYDRTISDGLFAYGFGQLAADQQQELDLRTRQGAGMGYRWEPGETLTMSFFGGVNAIQEKFEGLDRLFNAEGLMGFELDALALGGLEVTSRASYLPIFGENRYQLAFGSGVRFPVLYGFTYGFSLANEFDSNPPSDAEKNDLRFLMTIGYKF